ncbi:hypothetical protein OS493_037591, partial [Desmophyllum pertusum]
EMKQVVAARRQAKDMIDELDSQGNAEDNHLSKLVKRVKKCTQNLLEEVDEDFRLSVNLRK